MTVLQRPLARYIPSAAPVQCDVCSVARSKLPYWRTTEPIVTLQTIDFHTCWRYSTTPLNTCRILPADNIKNGKHRYVHFNEIHTCRQIYLVVLIRCHRKTSPSVKNSTLDVSWSLLWKIWTNLQHSFTVRFTRKHSVYRNGLPFHDSLDMRRLLHYIVKFEDYKRWWSKIK